MLQRLNRDRAVVGAIASGLVILLAYVAGLGMGRVASDASQSRAQQLLTLEPWYCDVHDPEGGGVVARSVETFHDGGVFEGRTRLEDERAGRLLLEFSYQGVWQFDDPWLTEAINDYSYAHVDTAAFSREQLAAIEAEFAEPEVSRVHAISEGQLVYGINRALYQCHRRPAARA